MITVAVVFVPCIGLTELLARTPLAKPLTGRTQVPWRRAAATVGRADGGLDVVGSRRARPARAQVPATAAAMAEAMAR